MSFELEIQIGIKNEIFTLSLF